MAIDDNTLYGLTGAQVKEMVQRRGNTEISQESSTYGNEGEALSLDSNGTDGHLRVGVDIMNDGSEAFLYLNDSYPSINLTSTDRMYEAIANGIPSDVSYFYNDAGYQSASQVSSAIASAISGITSFSYEIVQTLPASGKTGTIYLIANTGTTPNIYDEYLWVNGNWEKIGTTEADLSQYYTKTEVDTALGAKANSADVYTKTQADTLLNAKQNTLTAGSNVQIVNDTISATDTTYTAGTGINISNGVISATSTGPTVVQTTGTSTTDVMSQKATSDMIFAPGWDPATKYNDAVRVQIGRATANSNASIAIGAGMPTNPATASGNGSVVIGTVASSSEFGGVAIGYGAKATQRGQFDISATTGNSSHIWGYNGSDYRLLTGLYDPQSDHDAATKGYVDTAVAGAGASAFTTNEWNALWA